MALYKTVVLNGAVTGYARVNDDGSVTFVPKDNPTITSWLAAGNTPDPADTPPPPDRPIDYGTDASTRDGVVDAVVQLRQFLGLTTPTNAQVIGALKLLIRMVLFLAKSTMI
jgi:hypothetical protein